jgi:hypothetical protein
MLTPLGKVQPSAPAWRVGILPCVRAEGRLEDRGTVPGTSLGSMIGALASMEDNISSELYVHSLRISLTFTLY